MVEFLGPKSIRQYLRIFINAYSFLGLSGIAEINKTFQSTKWRLILPISYIVFLFSLFSYHLHGSLSSNFFFEKRNFTLVLYANVAGTLITAIIIISGAILETGPTCEMVNLLVELDENYYESNTKIVNSLSFKYLSINLSLFFSSVVFDCFYFSFDSKLSTFSIYICIFYTFLTVSEFSILLFWLKRSLVKFRGNIVHHVPLGKGLNVKRILVGSEVPDARRVKIKVRFG